jgi:hypothetical protein
MVARRDLLLLFTGYGVITGMLGEEVNYCACGKEGKDNCED